MKRFLQVKSIILATIISFTIAQTIYAEKYDRDWLIFKFNELDLAINNGEGYSNSTNEAGTLAWAQSYLLEAYLDMYEATVDKRYLEKFVIQADRVVNNTDKRRGIKDYKGRIRTGWSATKYSKNKEPMVFITHTGMILYPIVKFSLMVKRNEKLAGYKEISKKYVQFAEEAIKEFDGQWKHNQDTKEGYYFWEGDEPLRANLKDPIPFNGPLALGRVVVLMFLLTGKEEYKGKIEGLAVFFKNNLKVNSKGAFIWGYRPYLGKYSVMEDISHGAIDLDFAIQAHKAKIVFTDADMRNFAKTIINAKKDNGFFKYVDSTDDPADRQNPNAPGDISDASGRWLNLSEWNCEVYNSVYDYLIPKIKTSKKEHPSVMLGLAKLIKHFERCIK